MYPENIKQLSTKFDRERVSLAIAGKKTTNPMGKGWHVPHLVELRASVQSRKGERDCLWNVTGTAALGTACSSLRLMSAGEGCLPHTECTTFKASAKKKSQGFFSRPFLLL